MMNNKISYRNFGYTECKFQPETCTTFMKTSKHWITTPCFMYPLLFRYIFSFTKTNFMKIPEYTRGIGHYEHKINLRGSLTILCHCHYNEGTAKCQENKQKTRFILTQTSVHVISENQHLLPKLFNIGILQKKCSKCPPFAETQARRC